MDLSFWPTFCAIYRVQATKFNATAEIAELDIITGHASRNSGRCSPAPECRSLEGLFRRFCYGLHLVVAVAFHVLPQSVLRSVGTKFLSLLGRMRRYCAVAALSNSSRRPTNRHAGGKTLFAAMLAKRGPSSHAGHGAVLYWAGRLYYFHAGFSYFHCPSRPGIFSRGTRRYPAMAIPTWHFARIIRRIWRDLVSGKCRLTFTARRTARIIDCFHGDLLLGTLRSSDQTAVS